MIFNVRSKRFAAWVIAFVMVCTVFSTVSVLAEYGEGVTDDMILEYADRVAEYPDTAPSMTIAVPSSTGTYISVTNRTDQTQGIVILDSVVNFQTSDQILIRGSAILDGPVVSWGAPLLNGNPAGWIWLAQGPGWNYNWDLHGGRFVFYTGNVAWDNLPVYASEINRDLIGLISTGMRIQTNNVPTVGFRIYDIVINRADGTPVFNLVEFLAANPHVTSLDGIPALEASGGTINIVRPGINRDIPVFLDETLAEERDILFHLRNFAPIQNLMAPVSSDLQNMLPLREAGLSADNINVLEFEGTNYLHITGRTANWNAVELALGADDLYPGALIEISGRVYGMPPTDAQVVLNLDPGGWAVPVDQPLLEANELIHLRHILTEADINNPNFSVLRIMTNGDGAEMSFYIYDILVAQGEPVNGCTLVPDGTVLYSLSADTFIQGLSPGPASLGGTNYLNQSGEPNFTIIAHPNPDDRYNPEGINSIQVSGRENDWDGVDIVLAQMGMEPGNIYEVTLRGRTMDNVPGDASLMLQGYPGWAWADNQPVGSNEIFERFYRLTPGDMEAWSVIRVTTNADGASMPFIIDDIEFVRAYLGEPPGNIIDDRDNVYSLALDEEFQALTAGAFTTDGLTYLGTSGEPILTISQVDGTNIVHVSERGGAVGGQEWHTLELLLAPLRLLPGNAYNFIITGSIDGLAPEGMSMVLVGANDAASSWTWVQTIGVGGTNNYQFTFNYTATATLLGTFEALRFQTNDVGAEIPFFITGIEVTVAEPLPPRYWDMTLPSLRERFEPYFLFGNIWSTPGRMGAYNTEEWFLRHFNAVTAENAHKPGEIAPVPDPSGWNWATADMIVNWAADNNLSMIGHTLVWHSQSPLWMTGAPGHSEFPLLTRQEAIDNMHLFISTYVQRYEGRIYSWDVVNEVFIDYINWAAWEEAPYWRAHLRRGNTGLSGNNLRWYDAFSNGATGDECGSDYIYYAFRFTRMYTDAYLYYNDFNEEGPAKREAIATMVEEFNERWRNDPLYDGRLLIDRIGMQSHHHLDQWATNFDFIRPTIQRFIETGAGISVTELDVTIGGQGGNHPPTLPAPLTPEQQLRQAEVYGRLFGYFIEFSDYIYRVSIWGKADDHSWRSWGHPLLFDGNQEAKEAFWAVIEATANASQE